MSIRFVLNPNIVLNATPGVPAAGGILLSSGSPNLSLNIFNFMNISS
jgi:hypothetical protein